MSPGGGGFLADEISSDPLPVAFSDLADGTFQPHSSHSPVIDLFPRHELFISAMALNPNRTVLRAPPCGRAEDRNHNPLSLESVYIDWM
jgi:hypothetical protein